MQPATNTPDDAVRRPTKARAGADARPWSRFPAAGEAAWDAGAQAAAKARPLRTQELRPDLPGIRPATRRNLRWKALRHLVVHDVDRVFPRYIFRRPLRYATGLLRAYLRRRKYVRDGDFFLIGVRDRHEFERLLVAPDTVLVLGFSYCEKPFECPSGRFTDACSADPDHPVCRQCFIGKCINAQDPARGVALLIPTVHYIGEHVLALQQAHPNGRFVFMITACELTLEMFADWGNMAGIVCAGVRLDGIICNTMRAFEASERGIKPGLTTLAAPTAERLFDAIVLHRSANREAGGSGDGGTRDECAV